MYGRSCQQLRLDVEAKLTAAVFWYRRRIGESHIDRKPQFQLPGFELPSEDESDADANERGLFRLLLHILTRVALEIAEYAALHFALGLSCGADCLTLGVLTDTIRAGC